MSLTYVWTILAALVLIGGIAYRLRLHEKVGSRRTPLDDDQLRRIEETGRLDVEDEEPLDMDEIARAEDEFWEETWDEPEPW